MKNLGAGLRRDIVKLPRRDFLQIAAGPAEFGKFTTDEIDKWAKVIKFADIKSE